jgi:primosomal protein N' (replication factor Y) (superfamily II helicase)
MISYAQVVLPLPIDGPFDYSIPESLTVEARVGCRVRINFRNKKEVGFIVGLSDKTDIKIVKPVIDIIDRQEPLLGCFSLELAKAVSAYYYCSLGEAIAIGLPMALRLGRAVQPMHQGSGRESVKRSSCLIHDLAGVGRLKAYQSRIASCLENRKSVILLVPDKEAISRMQTVMEGLFPAKVFVLKREGKEEIQQWLDIRHAGCAIVIGTRSAVFAPAQRLGLIIVDEEQEYGYKQDQAPHYHARQVAIMRSQIEDADLLLGSVAPSLELMYAVKARDIDYELIQRGRPYPQVKIVDMKKLPVVSTRQKISLSGFLQDSIRDTVAKKGKVLLFLNRKGFATLAICSHCGKIFQCPRCSVNLNFHYEQKLMRCHYCNYTCPPPDICPDCKSGYVRFLGAGTEKLESELCRIFPQARIKRWESGSTDGFDSSDIFIATQAALRHTGFCFDLVGVLGIDNSLNHVDFRSAEKAYSTLCSLIGLANKNMVIQTNMAGHYVFDSLIERDPERFYAEELRQRKQLLFPPYRHFCFVKLRGKIEEKVHDAAQALFENLSAATKLAGISVMAVNPGPQPKLRGNYYWQILVAGKDVARINEFLRKNLKLFRQSGIIVTVDADPA